MSGKESTCNEGNVSSIPGWGKIPWGRAWQPTPVFLPGESHGRGAWRATVCWVTKSQTRLKRLNTRTCAVSGVMSHVSAKQVKRKTHVAASFLKTECSQGKEGRWNEMSTIDTASARGTGEGRAFIRDSWGLIFWNSTRGGLNKALQHMPSELENIPAALEMVPCDQTHEYLSDT